MGIQDISRGDLVAQDTAIHLSCPNLRLVLALGDTSLTWHVVYVADKPSPFASVGCAGQGDQAETDAIQPEVGSPDGQHQLRRGMKCLWSYTSHDKG